MVDIKVYSEEVFLTGETRELKDNVEGLIDDVVSILNNRMDKNDRVFLKKCLKRLQTKFNLSIEFIEYCLLTEKLGDKDALKFLHSRYGKSLIRKELAKFYRFLNTNGVKITKHSVSRLVFKRWNNNLKKVPEHRLVHSFRV